MTNMEIVQDYVARPRPPLVEYGTQPADTILGRAMVRYGGTRKIYWTIRSDAEAATGTLTGSGTISDGDTVTIGAVTYTFKTSLTPTAYQVLIGASDAIALDNLKHAVNGTGSAGTDYATGTVAHTTVTATTNTNTTQVFVAQTAGVAGNLIATTETGTNLAFGATTLTGGLAVHGKLYKQTDGGAFTLVGGAYDGSSYTLGVQSKGKLYLYNGVDNLSYVDLSDDSIVTYTALSTPSAPTVTMSGATSTGFTYYYRVTANNAVGESIASSAGSDTSNKPRDNWTENTDFMTISWSSVSGATSYTVYFGDSATTTNELYTTTGLTFTDYGTLAVNVFKLAPEGNSTEGAVFSWIYSDTKNSQLFGVTTDNYLYYSAPGTGDFSPYNGGGYVGIDVDGDTELNYVDGFRNGKGDPVLTVSARGAAGKGKLYHVSFESLTVGDQIIVYPNVYEANGQSGTYAPRATLKERDALYYPTGLDFKSTGTSQNIVNILTTNTISQVIEPDSDLIDLANLHKAVGVAHRDRLYFALPVSASTNNEIWYVDLSRNNLWVLRWNISADDMWLYEDSSGNTHFCALVDNEILEFSRAGAQPHQDNGVAWSSRLAFESMTWDEDGITLASIRNQYFKFLDPRGTFTAKANGLTRRAVVAEVGSDTFTSSSRSSFTGIGQWQYGAGHKYGEDPGLLTTSSGQDVAILKVKPRGLLNQLDWEVISSTAGTDYTLSAVNTRGFSIEELTLRTENS
jgi:hypothetical protein